MVRGRSFLFAVSLGVVALLAPPFAATSLAGPAAATTIACGQDVTTDVVLSHDLHCTELPAFRIVAPGVTVDLGGHTVSTTPDFRGQCQYLAVEPYSPGLCGIDVLEGATALTNGRLVDVEVGVLPDPFTTSDPPDLSRLQAKRSELVIANARLHHSTVTDGRVLLFGSGGGPTVDHNWLHRTPLTLINIQYGVQDFAIESNIVSQSPSYGIELDVSGPYPPPDVTGSIVGNWVLGSKLDGIREPGTSGPEGTPSLGPLTVADNVVAGNGGDGILLTGDLDYPLDVGTLPGGPVTVSGNRAFLNRGQGIVVTPTGGHGVIDGGGNRAWLNRVRPACVGVACSWW
jgi:hypothetical protein